MENRVQQPAPVQTRQFRIVRTGAQPLQRRCLPSAGTSTSNPPQQAAMELETPSQFAADHSPAARARKARRRLRRLFDAARRKAKGRARLCRADEHDVLRSAYRAVRAWRSNGVHEEIERELRAEAEVAVSREPFLARAAWLISPTSYATSSPLLLPYSCLPLDTTSSSCSWPFARSGVPQHSRGRLPRLTSGLHRRIRS